MNKVERKKTIHMNCGGCIIECLKINWILVGKINVLLPLFVDDSKSILKLQKLYPMEFSSYSYVWQNKKPLEKSKMIKALVC